MGAEASEYYKMHTLEIGESIYFYPRTWQDVLRLPGTKINQIILLATKDGLTDLQRQKKLVDLLLPLDEIERMYGKRFKADYIDNLPILFRNLIQNDFRISSYITAQVIADVDFILNLNTTINLSPQITLKTGLFKSVRSVWYGQSNFLGSTTFNQFALADYYANVFVRTQKIEYLDRLFCTLYAPDETPITQKLAEERAEKYKKSIPRHIKILCFSYFAACKKELLNKYANLFGEQKPATKAVNDANQWQKLSILLLEKTKQWKNQAEIGSDLVHNVFFTWNVIEKATKPKG